MKYTNSLKFCKAAGAGVSGWRLARAAAKAGALGVVSGTAIERIVLARLQEGDVGALSARFCGIS
jgi:NAD(P)H-dependent flavin oxidoreductase YrpB (nitropropane dioxygenase family)